MDNFFLRLILHLNKRSRSVGYIDDNYIVFDTKKKEHKTGHPIYFVNLSTCQLVNTLTKNSANKYVIETRINCIYYAYYSKI